MTTPSTFAVNPAGSTCAPHNRAGGTWAVSVSAGTGPVEVRVFVAQLAEALLALCTARGLGIEAVVVHGDERAPKSIELTVSGPAKALFANYEGTHVLVAKSVRRGSRSRKRWFAGVSLQPVRSPNVTQVQEVPPPQRCELEISAARAGGPGGQHVNTTESAIRVRHVPTGITVRVASERSQHRNRALALTKFQQILQTKKLSAVNADLQQQRMQHYRFARGNPVRAWQVDARTGQLMPLE